MAASSQNAVRLRLHFDYAPPAVSPCRTCLLLVDLNRCRVVADLVSVIRDRFDYRRGTGLDLFVGEYYLPPTESIFIVRDNDVLRVKEESLFNFDSAHPTPSKKEKKKKRRRDTDERSVEDGPKDAKRIKENPEGRAAEATNENKKKRKKKAAEKAPVSKPLTDNVSGKAPPARKPQEMSSDSSESSEEYKATEVPERRAAEATSKNKKNKKAKRKKTAEKPKVAPKQTTPGVKLSVSKPRTNNSSNERPSTSAVNGKTLAVRMQQETTSDSSEDEIPNNASQSKAHVNTANKTTIQLLPEDTTSSDTTSPEPRPPCPARRALTPPAKTTLHPQPPLADPSHAPTSSRPAQGPDSSDSSDSSEIELVIRKPCLGGMGLKVAHAFSPNASDHGSRGQDALARPGTGKGANRYNKRGRGGGRGPGNVRGTPWNYSNGNELQHNQSDILTNQSLVLQNPPEPLPSRDYSALPLLAAPPPVGQKIAFKLLELTENYTPEVSDYKEASVTGFNMSTNMIALELLSWVKAPTEPGKFDLVYQNPDGSESVEYAVVQGSKLNENWTSLLEPRLIV
ncbi:coilin [Denticeps clupeoides]|uniref:coilin n=1 Tax=Denticeps clupeoides TaxID=299321 RepID=UPI0010A2D6CC|nr:coilin [Denticeps clupeoides]